jgi:hypothetical protein
MDEPLYAVHERMFLRGKSLPEESPGHITFLLYEQLGQHIIRTYPESGPLRSIALRKLAESLNDVLDHAELTLLRKSPERPPARKIVRTSGAPEGLGTPASPADPAKDSPKKGIKEG